MGDPIDGEQRRIRVRGGELACHVSGDGPPLVLLHPSLADSRLWRPQRAALGRAHTLIAVDQRGHGQSAAPAEPYDPVSDVAEALAELQVERPVVMGLDDGAAVALRLALLRDDVPVRALVLANPGIGSLVLEADPEFDLSERLALARIDPEMEPVFAAAESGDSEELASILGDEPGALSHGHPDRALVQAMARTNIEAAYQTDLVLIPEPPYGEPRRHDVPTLLIMGEQPSGELVKKALRTRLSHIREVDLATGSNLINLELPEAFNAAVLDFLDELELAG